LWKFGAAERFLWWLQRKPLLLGAAEEKTHSASLCVAEKIPKCFVTVNIVAIFSNARRRTLCFPAGSVRGCAEAQYKKLFGILRGEFARLYDEPLQPSLA
jgi:hypothetical protein